jgi:hypothetical protein
MEFRLLFTVLLDGITDPPAGSPLTEVVTVQTEPQSIPAGEEVMVPVPVFKTARVELGIKAAVTLKLRVT